MITCIKCQKVLGSSEPYGTVNNKQYCSSCWKCANCQQLLGKMVNGYNGTIYEENGNFYCSVKCQLGAKSN